jgi:hypothetical protein
MTAAAIFSKKVAVGTPGCSPVPVETSRREKCATLSQVKGKGTLWSGPFLCGL